MVPQISAKTRSTVPDFYAGRSLSHPSTDDQGDKKQDDEYDEQNFGYIGSRSRDPPKSEETCEQRDDQERN